MIRVLIADDEPHVLSALADLVAQQQGMHVVAAVEDAAAAIAAAARLQPDVALLDVRMPGGGMAAVRGIAGSSPGTKTLALSAERDRQTVLEMLEAGSVGYLTKGCAMETILESILRAASGEASLSADVASGVIDEAVEHHGARRRERERRDAKADRIRGALTDGFEVVFQPILDLATREPVGYEALSRFADATPDVWFADAAEIGLGIELELAAVEAAVPAFALLGSGFLSLNVSPSAAIAPSFPAAVDGIPLDRIVLEITEHAPIDDYDRLNRSLGGLREAGLRLAIDDAGAGFASLRHILRLGPDLIKLDRALIGGIDAERSQQALARGLTSFAHGIEAAIVAEGIERSEEIAMLDALGIEYGQGFLLGPPSPLSG